MDESLKSTWSEVPGAQSEMPVPMPALACLICLRRIPTHPVLTVCGHVFCWPCLYRSWPQEGLEITQPCPACGTVLAEGVDIDPLFGIEGSSPSSPRSGTEGSITGHATAASDIAIPPRPSPGPLRIGRGPTHRNPSPARNVRPRSAHSAS